MQQCLLRVNVYMQNDEELFKKLYDNKNEIEKSLGFAPIWAHGEKGKNTYRIKVELPLTAYDREDYQRVIEKSIPIVKNFLTAFRPYVLY